MDVIMDKNPTNIVIADKSFKEKPSQSEVNFSNRI
jgi:hypothetical protein